MCFIIYVISHLFDKLLALKNISVFKCHKKIIVDLDEFDVGNYKVITLLNILFCLMV